MYRSQWKQDYILNNKYFNNKFGGVFVDVGAHDGVTYSNTYFYEKMLGWSGLCIEPLSNRYNELAINRSCVCINGCAYNEDKVVDFVEIEGYSEMLSGIYEQYDERHLARLKSEVEENGGKICISKTDCFRLETLFDRYGIVNIDYLTIDTEGSELNVLKGINFSKVNISLIDVENNYDDKFEPVKEFLIENGYIHVDSIKGDEIFIRPYMIHKPIAVFN